MIEKIKLSNEYTIYKTKYNWKYTKEEIILKYKKNYDLCGKFDLNTSPIFLNCKEFDSIFKIPFNISKNLSNGGDDWMGKKWFYIQKNNNTFEKYHSHKFIDNKDQYIGKQATIKFYERTPKGIPFNANLIAIKDE
jgi:hypothetical protein